MNTRRFPRTMNEAFRQTVEYGAAIELPAPKTWVVTYALCFAGVVLSLLFQGAP